jgi:hypothetical protein
MTSDPFFETTPSVESPVISGGVKSSSTPNMLEIALLLLIAIIGVVDIALSVSHSTVGWISGYLVSVLLGVPILGFHTQSVLRRFEKLGSAVTSSAQLVRILLVLLLLIPAFANAAQLAVAWSS